MASMLSVPTKRGQETMGFFSVVVAHDAWIKPELVMCQIQMKMNTYNMESKLINAKQMNNATNDHTILIIGQFVQHFSQFNFTLERTMQPIRSSRQLARDFVSFSFSVMQNIDNKTVMYKSNFIEFYLHINTMLFIYLIKHLIGVDAVFPIGECQMFAIAIFIFGHYLVFVGVLVCGMSL